MKFDYTPLVVDTMLLVVQCSNGYIGYCLLTRPPTEDMTFLAVLLVVNIYLIIVACGMIISKVKNS